MNLIFDPAAPGLTGYDMDFNNISYQITELPIAPSVVSAQTTLKDAIFQLTTTTTKTSNFKIVTSTNPGAPPATVTNLTPTIGSLAGDGTVTQIADGEMVVDMNNFFSHKQYKKTFYTGNSLQYGDVTEHPVGSLSRHVADYLKAAISGKTLSDSTVQVFTSGWVPNATRILPAVDMSWQEVYHGSGNNQGPCALIGPRHALANSHFNLLTGQTLPYDSAAHPEITSTFRRRDGTFQTVKPLNFRALGNDITLIYFDQDVTNCAFVKLAPYETLNTKLPLVYSPDYSVRYSMPCIQTLVRESGSLSGGRKLLISSINSSHITVNGRQINSGGIGPNATQHNIGELKNWYGTVGIQSNDSGSHTFIPVIEPGNSTPTSVLLQGAWFQAGDGPEFGAYITQINAAMNDTAGVAQGTYSVQIADLSAFTNF